MIKLCCIWSLQDRVENDAERDERNISYAIVRAAYRIASHRTEDAKFLKKEIVNITIFGI
eukprot:SAG11_NODE_5262_length_1612_cov_1.762723_2_plen_60_part_00